MTTLFVGNLSPETTESDLHATFAAFGRITSLRVARSRGGRSRGFAFVELEDEAARAAMEALKGAGLKGRTMDVAVDTSSGHQGRHPRRTGFRRRR
ncbi:MAG: RNA-binding protein [Dehalococcoidia bacterium]|nr:RNA-binding protein [Dehalococcoidia bacterium]